MKISAPTSCGELKEVVVDMKVIKLQLLSACGQRVINIVRMG
jgi:hypothetical protein